MLKIYRSVEDIAAVLKPKKAGFVIHCTAAFPIRRPHFPDSQLNLWICDDKKFPNSLGNFLICCHLWLSSQMYKFSWKIFLNRNCEFVMVVILWFFFFRFCCCCYDQKRPFTRHNREALNQIESETSVSGHCSDHSDRKDINVLHMKQEQACKAQRCDSITTETI